MRSLIILFLINNNFEKHKRVKSNKTMFCLFGDITMALPRNSLTHFELSFLFLDISVMMLPKLRNIVLLLFTCLTLFSTFL